MLTAGTAAAALELTRLKEPNIVLLDLRLGQDDGMSVLQQIKQSRPHIVVIIMTAYGSIQSSVDAIKAIAGCIENLSAISAAIASAVEEQGAATQEISRNVQQAAQGTQQVSSNITDVQRGASETGSASSQVLSAAQALSRDSNLLKLEVGKFLDTVRAA